MIQTYRSMLKVAGSYAPQLQASLTLSVVASVIQGTVFALFFPLLDALMVQPIDVSRIWTLIAIFALLVFVEAILRWYELHFAWVTATDVTHEIRLVLGEQLRRIPLEALNQRRSGDINVVLSSNVANTVVWMGNICKLIIQTIVAPTVTILITVFIDWRLAIALLIVFPLAVPIYRQIRTITRQLTKEMDAADADASSRIVEYVQGLPVLRATKQVGQQSRRLRESLVQQRHVQANGQRLTTWPTIMMATVVQVGILAVLALGVWFILQGSLSIPSLFALVVIAVRFSEPLAILSNLTTVFDLMESGLERIEALIGIQPLPIATPPAQITRYDIDFEHVTFTYADQHQPVLQDVSFHLPERSLTALVGPSGSGKTTITRLISRYADVQSGAIRIGGVDVRNVDQSELMRHISVVFQDVYLFDDTIRNNIRLGKPDATDTDIETAARAANCHEFISHLPNGYDTQVGEIGAALSGGERQRISIARAILKDSPIVLLDEPTSALDTQSEVAVQSAINKLVANKTVLVIAHRLSTVVGADLILVLDEGCVVERGTHAELLTLGGRYTAMWKSQQRSRGWRIAATADCSELSMLVL